MALATLIFMTERAPNPSAKEGITRQYNQIGNDYIAGKEAFFKESPDLGKEFLAEHLKDPEEKSLLDVGCGAGAELLTYRDKMRFKSVLGVDPSRVMVEEARKAAHDPQIAQIGDWEHLPATDASQDYVIGRFSLHYVEGTDASYLEAARVLKPGGELLLILPHPDADMVVEEGGKKVVKTSLFEGKVVVTYPPHAMEEYLSPTFHRLFELLEKKDYKSFERDAKVPVDSMAIIARKR